ncbi:cyclin-dependent kinase inhibitor 1B-like isoform X1 [Pristis pectinata]|uniref:cyclin-dependent kinase inhibitor 1B-like isoform X1 n=1 Tax=Pristis pectinata TaxID=685728 RepID=UPI00223CF752|nr:cyclin-dependent kinase inhibitor 1B-like isoform X1 [Pristis pectinata]XP_051886342.1 cyclin-dependent kinase inhibitor 1B-like isoform X1 [Pristis pectinata]
MMGLNSEEQKLEIDLKSKSDRVRRNLFGPVDHEQLQQDFQHLLRANIEAAEQRWNYDFSKEIPAEGTLEWEELKCQDVPAFYRSRVISKAKHLCGLQEACVRSSSDQPAPPSKEIETQVTPEPKRKRQTCITGMHLEKCGGLHTRDSNRHQEPRADTR